MTGSKELIKEYSLKPNKALGQNFLVDREAVSAIVSAASEPGLPILEIGPGLGALTEPLVQTGLRVAAVELDGDLADILKKRLDGKALIINEDFLKTDLSGVSASFGGEFVCVGNLPYYITSPIVTKLVTSPVPIKRMVLMMQSEAADRFFASAGDKNYGPLTIMSGYRFDIGKLISLSPDSYYPMPEVGSSVLVFESKGLELPRGFERVLKASFSMRRKTLTNNLMSLGLKRADAEAIIREAGLDPAVRAEALGASDFLRLSELLNGRF
ncbi:MAG: 16S rRNA (adenine(1518)-N(6)/adenine(1519)-N(6))-dimethyltransferase RsmA [Clostridiales bacterium]|nr:16S rRNA (adenine(1518)-N(6)/adenine(1519)-N(6))-dimethyltransferase RsmA [Clostridiales bacterium]